MGRRRVSRTAPASERFITLHHWMLKSPAFRELSGNASKLLLVMALRFNGHNNGNIAMSVREAAREVKCSKNHVPKLIRELMEKGFINITQRGAFTWKSRQSSTYKLNWLPTNDPGALGGLRDATKEFMRWQPPEHIESSQVQTTVSPHGTNSATG